jgi:sigma-B regulation protein RsbQ
MVDAALNHKHYSKGVNPMTRTLRFAFVLGRRVHLHRLLFCAVALVLAFGTASEARFESKPARDDKVAAGESRFATLDGARIHYVNYGKGSDAMVLIHGWTCNIDNWRDQLPDFSRRNRVIAIDLPGHGQSDKPQITYSMDHFARAVEAVMRDAKVKRAVLVGHSMGTPIARQFYRKYPKKTLAIVVVDGPLRPFADKATMDGMVAGFRGANYREVGSQMLVSFAGPNLPVEAKERIQASFMNTPQHVLASAMEGMADSSIWGEDKIMVPVLAIMAKGPLFQPNIEPGYREIAPKMDFQMWEGIGHFIMMEKPKEFNEVVVAFLDKNKLVKKT